MLTANATALPDFIRRGRLKPFSDGLDTCTEKYKETHYADLLLPALQNPFEGQRESDERRTRLCQMRRLPGIV